VRWQARNNCGKPYYEEIKHFLPAHAAMSYKQSEIRLINYEITKKQVQLVSMWKYHVQVCAAAQAHAL